MYLKLFLLLFVFLAKCTLAAGAAEAGASEFPEEHRKKAISVLEQTCAIYVIDGKEVPEDLSTMKKISPKYQATGTLARIPHPSDPDTHKLAIITVSHLAEAEVENPVYFCQIRLNIEDEDGEEEYALLYKNLIRFDNGAFDSRDESALSKCIQDPTHHSDLAVLAECLNPDILEELPAHLTPAELSTNKILKKDTPTYFPRIFESPLLQLEKDSDLYLGSSLNLCYCIGCSSVPEDFEEKISWVKPSNFIYVPGNSGSGFFIEESDAVYLKGVVFSITPKPESITPAQVSLLESAGYDPSAIKYYIASKQETIFYLFGPEDLERIQEAIY